MPWTPDEFANRIKLKYPDYADMDNQTLTDKMLAKFPDYKDDVISSPKESFWQKITPNIPQGVSRFTEPMGFIEKPLQTISRGIERGTEAVEGALRTPGLLGGVRTTAKIGTAIFPKSPADVALAVGTLGGSLGYKFGKALISDELLNSAKLLRNAPEFIRANEVAKLVQKYGQKRVDEAMSLAEMETGKFAKPQATGRLAKIDDQNRINTLFQKTGEQAAELERQRKGLLIPRGKPFTFQGGISAEENAALDAFQAKLPQTRPPVLAPEAPPLPVARTLPAVGPVSPVPAVTQALPPEQTIINAMKSFKKIRGQQNILLAQARAKRFAAVEAIGKTIPGEAGFDAKLKALTGGMGRVEFESIASQVPKSTKEWAFNAIENSPILSTTDKVTAGRGLKKIFGEAGGAIPQDKELEYLAEVFSPEFMAAVPQKTTIGTVGTMVSNLTKSMRATLDVSIPFRQGFFFIGRPKQWIPAFGNMYKYVFSKDALTAATKRIQARPLYKLGRESGLSLPKTEEVFVSDAADRIPGFAVLHKASKQAATGFLNDLRSSVFDDMAQKFRTLKDTDLKLFKKMENIPDDVVYKNIAGLTNAGTGRGNLGMLENSVDVLNMAIFSPRLVASRLQLLYPGYYMKLDPFTRKEALKSLFTTVGIGMSVLGIAKLGGATVGDDDTSADFGKIKVGDTRFDIWAGFQQPIVAAARLARNKMISSTTGKEFELGEGYKAINRWDITQRFLESKRSPVAAFVQDLIRGKTGMGEKFDVPAEVIEQFVPMITEDMMDLYKEWGPMGLLMAIPGAHGVGSQTYGDQVPVKEITPTGTEKTRWEQKPNVGRVAMGFVRKLASVPENVIPEAERKILVEQRKAKNIEDIEAEKIKAQVIKTGLPQRFGNKIFYLEKGSMKTKDLSETTESKEIASAKSLTEGVSNELRYLGIPFTPNDNQAERIDKDIIADMDYKKLSKDDKKAMMNRYILFRQQSKK